MTLILSGEERRGEGRGGTRLYISPKLSQYFGILLPNFVTDVLEFDITYKLTIKGAGIPQGTRI
jgi:hypothetical protein